MTHPKYNAKDWIDQFLKAGGTVLACGTCIEAHDSEGTEVRPISTMNDCVAMVEWADKVITF